MSQIKKSIFLIIISLLISISLEKEYEATIGGKTILYNAKYLVDEDLILDKGEFTSSTFGETLFLVIDGAKFILEEGVIIRKENSEETRRLMEDQNTDNFKYGTNSAIVVLGPESKAILNGITLTTTGEGAHGVVSIDSSQVEINESQITTSSDNSIGLLSVEGGEITADTDEITTNGNSSPAIAGEGIISASGMTLTTEGLDSPLIYSQGSLTLFSSNGNAKQAQISIIEGPHSLTFNGCDFTCSGKGKLMKTGDEDGDKDANAGIAIYTESDVSSGMANFECLNTNLVVDDSDNLLAAPLFLVSNNLVCVTLNHNTFSLSSGVFIQSMGHSDVRMTAEQMDIKGDILAKGISTIDLKYDCSSDSNFKSDGSVTSDCL